MHIVNKYSWNFAQLLKRKIVHIILNLMNMFTVAFLKSRNPHGIYTSSF